MNAPGTPSPRSVYTREQLSPDGRWHIAYDYMDGEKSPLIVSPRVTEIATDRVVVDLWRSSLDGEVADFTPTGFRITVRDPFFPKQLVAMIDTVANTFVLDDRPAAVHPLPDLYPVLREIIEQARRDYRVQNPPPPRPRPESPLHRLQRWLSGRS